MENKKGIIARGKDYMKGVGLWGFKWITIVVVVFTLTCAVGLYSALYIEQKGINVTELTNPDTVVEKLKVTADTLFPFIGCLDLDEKDRSGGHKFIVVHPKDATKDLLAFESQMVDWISNRTREDGTYLYDGVVFGHGTERDNSFYFGNYKKSEFIEANKVMEGLSKRGYANVVVLTCNTKNFDFSWPVVASSKGDLKVIRHNIKILGIFDTDKTQLSFHSDNFNGYFNDEDKLVIKEFPESKNIYDRSYDIVRKVSKK